MYLLGAGFSANWMGQTLCCLKCLIGLMTIVETSPVGFRGELTYNFLTGYVEGGAEGKRICTRTKKQLDKELVISKEEVVKKVLKQ